MELKEQVDRLATEYGFLYEVSDEGYGIKLGNWVADICYRVKELNGMGMFATANKMMGLHIVSGESEEGIYSSVLKHIQEHIRLHDLKPNEGDLNFLEDMKAAAAKPRKHELYSGEANLRSIYEYLGCDKDKMDKFFDGATVYTDIKGVKFLKSIGL